MNDTTDNKMKTGLMTVRDLALRCNVSISTVRRWVRRGLVPVVTLPDSNMRFRPEDVASFVERQRDDREDASCSA